MEMSISNPMLSSGKTWIDVTNKLKNSGWNFSIRNINKDIGYKFGRNDKLITFCQ